MMNAYRAHKDTLQPGDMVPPSTSFFDAMRGKAKRLLNDFWNQFVPCTSVCVRPKRKNAFFVFEDENEGRKWASQKKRHLYIVELKPDCILHRADWSWLSVIMDALVKDDPQTAMYANNYWAGKTTERPVWELLVTSATVTEEIIISELERNRLSFEALGLPDLRD